MEKNLRYIETAKQSSYRRSALKIQKNLSQEQNFFKYMPYGVKLHIISHLSVFDLARLGLTSAHFQNFATGAAFYRLEYEQGVTETEARLLSASSEYQMPGALSVLHHTSLRNEFLKHTKPKHNKFACGEAFSIFAKGKKLFSAGVLPERRASPPCFKLSKVLLTSPIRVKQISCGDEFYMLVTSNGRLCIEGREIWRVNNWRPPHERGGSVLSASAGQHHGCVLTSRGDVYGFGKKLFPNHQLMPLKKIQTPAPVVHVQCGGNVTFVVDNRRKLYKMGQWENNNSAGYSRIRGVSNVKQLAIGLKHTIIMGTRIYPNENDENKNFEKSLPETELWALGRNNEKQCATKPSRNSVSFEDMNSLLLALPDTNFLHRSPTVCRALKSELRRRIVSIVFSIFFFKLQKVKRELRRPLEN